MRVYAVTAVPRGPSGPRSRVTTSEASASNGVVHKDDRQHGGGEMKETGDAGDGHQREATFLKLTHDLQPVEEGEGEPERPRGGQDERCRSQQDGCGE